MIAENIGRATIQAGHTGFFTTAAQTLLDPSSQESARGLERRLRYYASMRMLVCDEIGHPANDNRNADLLFPNAACIVAMIDRRVHHADMDAGL